jgi:small nuclear ribonucleoprotein (snRNP)-like protein
LTEKQQNTKVVLELKNDMKIAGTLSSVDENLNFYLTNMKVIDEENHPYLMSCKNGFIRGNTVRYVHLQKKEVDTEPLTEACRKEAKKDKSTR